MPPPSSPWTWRRPCWPTASASRTARPTTSCFRGPEPVFIDVLSFERRQPGDATWLPYAQFVRTFLLPLLANQAYGLSLDQILTTRRDGLEPEEVYRWSKLSQRLRPPFFSLVSMPTWLGGKHQQDDTSIYQKKLLSDPEKARFILDHVLHGLAAHAAAASSRWRARVVCGRIT
jgi:hypothetical protein